MSRNFAGQNLSHELFEFGRRECAARGVNRLRLDTGAKRFKLHKLYEGNGFRKVEIKTVGVYTCMKYEMKV